MIVVDDGSTDHGPGLVRRMQDPRIRLLSQANAGPAAARNHGVRIAQGEILTFLDADDEWAPDYLSGVLRILDEHGPSLAGITCGMKFLPTPLTSTSIWRKAGLREGVFEASEQAGAEQIAAILASTGAPTTVFRRSIFEELGGFYEKNRCRFSEDAHLLLKIFLLRRPFYLWMEDKLAAHTDASGLSGNYAGVRPIEPFLLEPEEIYSVCLPQLREVARCVLARRALKTAAVYGYWGHHETARQLVSRFVSLTSDWRLPFFPHALMGCTPAGGWIGKLQRMSAARRALRRSARQAA